MHIILPTGPQWQRAAQSDDNRLYPWGNMFDPNRCNTRESRIRMTTLVMNYAGGGSPYGVQDMSGNVWEWCLNTGHESAGQTDITSGEPRLIHGGSFISGHYRAQAAFYFALNPEYHYGSIGFRIALMP
jgi:formylglycine-generating enzyme required for sulfatase activity